MEMRLSEGRYVPTRPAGFEQVTELDELAQRIGMKLTARRGKFMPLPDYGSRLYMLPALRPSQRETAARQYVIEALSDETDVTLESIDYSPQGSAARLELVFTYKGNERLTITTEV